MLALWFALSTAASAEPIARLALHEIEEPSPELALDGPLDLLEPLPSRPNGSEVPESRLYERVIEQCRSFRRNLSKIGKDASPDGRPQTCRLISFMRRQRWRDAMGRRRRLRWQPPVVELPRLRPPPLPVVAIDAPAPPRVGPAPQPPSLKPIPLILLLSMLPKPVPVSAPRASVKGPESR